MTWPHMPEDFKCESYVRMFLSLAIRENEPAEGAQTKTDDQNERKSAPFTGQAGGLRAAADRLRIGSQIYEENRLVSSDKRKI